MPYLYISSLKGIRAKVWQSRMESPLFDTANYASDLERLYMKMWKRFESGQAPDHITELSVV